MLLKLVQKHKNSPTFLQSLANYVDRAWALILSILLARMINPEAFGLLAFGLSIALLSVFVCRWETLTLLRSDPYYRKEGFNIVLRLTGNLVLGEILLIFLVATIVYLMEQPIELSIIIIVYGVFAALDRFALILKCDLEGELNFKPNLYAQLLFPPISALIVLPMAYFGLEVWALLTICCLRVIVNWIVYRKANQRKLSFVANETDELGKLMKASFWLWLDQLCMALIMRGDKALLGSVAGEKELAGYNRSYNFSPISIMILGGIVGAPAIVAIAKTDSSKAQFKVFIQRASWLVGAGIINGMMWFYFSREIIGFIFGANWLFAAPMFKMLAFFGAVSGLYQMSHALLTGRKEFKALACLKLSSIMIVAIVIYYLGVTTHTVAYGVQAAMIIISLFIVVYFFHKTQFLKEC